MNLEVLAPAGSEESLAAAWAAGADAVYLALEQFGARAYAKNFTAERAIEVIEQAHRVGKKVYVTMNTLLEEEQMEEAYQQARRLHEYGVDALIIQDLGLIHLLHHRLPELELHASTQLSVSTPRQIEQLRKLGVSRVVLARETSLADIEACAATGMEIEVFVHGALCISYSGQCRFSQVRYDRSGNKGKCAQACRMEYTLEENGQPVDTAGRYLLSPRDLSLIEQIPRLQKAGVLSLKIEGRMKSPEYVYESVRAARAAADRTKPEGGQEEKMRIAFNRGYTKGHVYDLRGEKLMNAAAPNHQGISAGTVLSVRKDRAKVRLSHDLSQNDGIRFTDGRFSGGQNANFIFDENGKLVAGAKKGQTVEIQVISGVRPGMGMRLTASFSLQKEVEDAIRQRRPQAPVEFLLRADQIGAPLELIASDGHHEVKVVSEPVEAARKSPDPKRFFEQIEKSLSKTGDTWARVESIRTDLPEGIFIPASRLNEMRRQAIEALGYKRTEVKPVCERPYAFMPEPVPAPESYALIMNRKQAMDDGLQEVSEFPIAGTLKKAPIDKDEGGFTDSLGNGSIVENLNITNSYALAALLELGYRGGVLAGELSDSGRKDLLTAFKARYGFDAPAIYTVYERPRLMVMKHCPVNTVLKDGKREHCVLCRTNRYTLKGKDGKRGILLGNPDCHMQIFDEQPFDAISAIDELEQEGLRSFRLVFSSEDQKETRAVRSRFLQTLGKAEQTAD